MLFAKVAQRIQAADRADRIEDAAIAFGGEPTKAIDQFRAV
jgi:hypothetical protein